MNDQTNTIAAKQAGTEDTTDRSVLSKAASKQLEKLRSDITRHVKACLEIEVLDADSADRATAVLATANRRLKEADKVRAELKKPYLEAGRKIDAFFKDEIESAITPALEHGKQQIRKWNDHLERLRREEMERIEAERRKREEEEAKEQARIRQIRQKIDDYDRNVRAKIRSSFLVALVDGDQGDLPDGSIEAIIAKLSAPPAINWTEIFAEQYPDFIATRSALLDEAEKHREWLQERHRQEQELRRADAEQKAEIEKTQRLQAELRAKEMKLQEEQERLRREKAAADEARRLAEESKERAAQEQEARRIAEIETKAVNTRTTWTYEVEDRSAVPPEFLCIDDAKVKAFIAANKEAVQKGTAHIKGIKFVSRQGIVLR